MNDSINQSLFITTGKTGTKQKTMKAFLYAGATLMIGASIYGFVSYKQTQNRKEFKTMYVEEKQPVVVPDEPAPAPEAKTVVAKTTTVEKKEVRTTPVKTTTNNKAVKKIKKKKRFDARIFSRAPLKEDYEELIPAPKVEEKKIENKVQ